MEEKNGDAKTFWMELQDDGKVDLMFEKTQNVLHSLKQKIKDGSATNGDYVQAMNLVNEATLSNTQTLEKDHTPMTQSEQENKSSAVPSASCDNSCPKGCTVPYVYVIRVSAPSVCCLLNIPKSLTPFIKFNLYLCLLVN
uniref:Uncharacterized protein n=1 Tax=Mus spicilegus TaxID=10103 RepID=A0A8C6I3Y1_MUSSI